MHHVVTKAIDERTVETKCSCGKFARVTMSADLGRVHRVDHTAPLCVGTRLAAYRIQIAT